MQPTNKDYERIGKIAICVLQLSGSWDDQQRCLQMLTSVKMVTKLQELFVPVNFPSLKSKMKELVT